MSTNSNLPEPRTAQADPRVATAPPAKLDNSLAADPATRRRAAGPAVGVIAARVLTVAAAALIFVALIAFAFVDPQAGNSRALIVSGAFGISAGVLGLVVVFINVHRGTRANTTTASRSSEQGARDG